MSGVVLGIRDVPVVAYPLILALFVLWYREMRGDGATNGV